MPQFSLSNGELLKKSLRVTGLMVGTTALWLGALSGAVMMSTGSSSSGAVDSKVEKAAGGVTPPGPRGLQSSSVKTLRHGAPETPKGDAPHPGDPI